MTDVGAYLPHAVEPISEKQIQILVKGWQQDLAVYENPRDLTNLGRRVEFIRAAARKAGHSRNTLNEIGAVLWDTIRKAGAVSAEIERSDPKSTLKQGPVYYHNRREDVPTAANLGYQTPLQRQRWELCASLPDIEVAHLRDKIIGSADKTLTQSELIAAAKAWLREQEIEQQAERIAAGVVVDADGPFDVIEIDPPWPYGTRYDPDGRRGAPPYPEMTLDEIAALPVAERAADDCILWLWTTHKFMRHSFPLLDRWGFEDKQIVTWVKDRMGLGSWLRSQSEFCIMAVRGNPQVLLTNQTTVIHGDLREHSRKPDEFFSMVEGLCLGLRRYQWFAREAREGWASGGNDTEKFSDE